MTVDNPLVSIITPSLNCADIIHETAASIFSQTYPYWEWVIVDDGNRDNSLENLEECEAKDEQVKIFKRDREPKGAFACRNIAVEKSTGDSFFSRYRRPCGFLLPATENGHNEAVQRFWFCYLPNAVL